MARVYELFQTQVSPSEVDALLTSARGRQRLEEELADILIFLLYLSHRSHVDLTHAVRQKLELNRNKYPVDKSYNRNTKNIIDI